jgi:hypothetical protein
MVNTIMTCGARICKGLNLRSRYPRTTCVTTCLVWNSLLNKLVHSGMCLASGAGYRFKCVTLGICRVQLRRVKCVHVDPLQYDVDGV